MRKVMLSDKREVILGVFHEAVHAFYPTYDKNTYEYKDLKTNDELVPSTHVVMTDPSLGVVEEGQVHFDGRSVCRHGDNFNKLEGRRRAAIALLRQLREKASDRYNVNDREAIFFSICPEFASASHN
jgi:hypothetical protein